LPTFFSLTGYRIMVQNCKFFAIHPICAKKPHSYVGEIVPSSQFHQCFTRTFFVQKPSASKGTIEKVENLRSPIHQYLFIVNFLVCPIWLLLFSFFSIKWTRIGCRNWSWHGFDTAFPFSIGWYSNPQPSNPESSLLTTRPDFRHFMVNFD